MYTNIQEYFRFYLALFLAIILAVGVRLQAAPLGAGPRMQDELANRAPAARPPAAAGHALAAR